MVDIHRVVAAEEGYAPEAREPAGYRLSDASTPWAMGSTRAASWSRCGTARSR